MKLQLSDEIWSMLDNVKSPFGKDAVWDGEELSMILREVLYEGGATSGVLPRV